VIKLLLYPVTYPISKALDCLLGEEIGSIHSTNELTNLLRIHVDHDAVDEEQGDIMIGAVTYKDKKIYEVMTPLSRVHMLSLDDTLSFETVSEIFKKGFSRIPIYGVDRNDVRGMLFTKDLIFIDPDDDTPVGQFVQIFGRSLFSTSPDQTLGQLLKHFKSGKGHMALVLSKENSHDETPLDVVRETSFDEHTARRVRESHGKKELLGVVTLEDIIEEILQVQLQTFLSVSCHTRRFSSISSHHHCIAASLAVRHHPSDRLLRVPPQDEIVDETDVYLEMESDRKVQRKEKDFDYALLRLLDSKLTERTLAPEEVGAVTKHLRIHHGDTFAHEVNGVVITEAMIRRMIEQSMIVAYEPHKADGTDNFIYLRGEVTTYCTIVLTGKLEIAAGRDGFRSFASAWSVLAPQSLTAKNGAYKPDFSAVVRDKLRCIQVSQEDFFQMVFEKPEETYTHTMDLDADQDTKSLNGDHYQGNNDQDKASTSLLDEEGSRHGRSHRGPPTLVDPSMSSERRRRDSRSERRRDDHERLQHTPSAHQLAGGSAEKKGGNTFSSIARALTAFTSSSSSSSNRDLTGLSGETGGGKELHRASSREKHDYASGGGDYTYDRNGMQRPGLVRDISRGNERVQI
jgi:metal transporter CNNM